VFALPRLTRQGVILWFLTNCEGAEYRGVTLLESPFRKQRDETLETYLLHLSNDDILHRFRVRAGIPSHVNGMPGWGPSVGQYLGRLCQAVPQHEGRTGAGEMSGPVPRLVRVRRRCGELMATDTYSWEKLLGGMLDIYEFMEASESSPGWNAFTPNGPWRPSARIFRARRPSGSSYEGADRVVYAAGEPVRAYQLSETSSTASMRTNGFTPIYGIASRADDFAIGRGTRTASQLPFQRRARAYIVNRGS
jgi:hypothetical protein